MTEPAQKKDHFFSHCQDIPQSENVCIVAFPETRYLKAVARDENGYVFKSKETMEEATLFSKEEADDIKIKLESSGWQNVKLLQTLE